MTTSDTTDLDVYDIRARLAERASGYLVRGERGAPGIDAVLITAPDAPQWVTDLCGYVHASCSYLPCDWTYEMLGDVLTALDEADGDDGVAVQYLDLDSLYPYTAQRRAWVANAAEASMGHEEESHLGPFDTMDAAHDAAMRHALHTILYRVCAWLDLEGEDHL